LVCQLKVKIFQIYMNKYILPGICSTGHSNFR